ncbi:ATPase [Actinokineospora spheciospongiae]|uniref:ATPase n=1 Tax=Actinokineospora spheciospongiae TaxID=909613 RepID=W7ICP6_9PSEU|nr:DUF349 domain-containing protein [Actinokineospora spheciospongiae]EWC58283.1 ATPase [Actinokineospora spheciospongiae]
MTDNNESAEVAAEDGTTATPDAAPAAAPVDTAATETTAPAGAPAETAPEATRDAATGGAAADDTAVDDTAVDAAAADEPAASEPPATAPSPAAVSPASISPASVTPATVTPATVAAPAAAPAAPTAPVGTPPVVAVASSDPGRWGRVDADGTVYVKTADGERAVGSWQAGEPAEGLAHFARRFDDIRTEVELLEARLTSGSGDPKQAAASAKQIRESLDEAHVVGDLAALSARIDFVLGHAAVALDKAKHAREEAKAAAVARKQALVEEVERLAEESTQWKVAGDRLRAVLDEWKTIKGVDRKTDEQLWRRFSKARDTFNRRRGSHFADLDRQRATAKSRKQELVELAEALSESDDWGPTAGRYKDLMQEWKAAGRAPKDADDTLWQRFRAAQDKFFARRSAVFDERDAEFSDNAKAKEELLVEAEKIDPATSGLEAARGALHKVQERWEEIGKVPRERIRELEGRLRAVEDRVRQASEAQWRRTDPEAEARAAQFRERVAQFEAQAAKARAAGDKRRAEQAEAQAAQWREWLAAAEQAVASR